MPIDFSCACGKRLRAKDHHAGKQTTCPQCGEPVEVPAPPVFASLAVEPDDAADGMPDSYQPPPVPASNGSVAASSPAPDFDGERVFLNERGWLVTDRRLMFGGNRLYATAHLVSVVRLEKGASVAGHVLVLLLGGVFLFVGMLASQSSPAGGIVLAIMGIAAAALGVKGMLGAQSLAQVVFSFSSGATRVADNLDPDFAIRLAIAARQAVVARG